MRRLRSGPRPWAWPSELSIFRNLDRRSNPGGLHNLMSRGAGMGQTTDVFVVGGGPAGLAAAIAARKRGLDVIVADGARPPIDKPCGEGLMPDTLSALRELGVAINPVDGFAFRGIRFVDEGVEVDGQFPFGQGLGLRRPLLHQRMIERAQ